MTNKEAIEELKCFRENMLLSLGRAEALDKAIQALETQRWSPTNATNGDMIISLYPNLKYYVKGDRMMTTIGVASSFDLEWWNAPYREGGFGMTIQEKAIEQLERISEHLSSIGEKEDYTDIAIQALEQQPNRCDSCTHSEEQDGSNCYECVKGMADNFEAQPTSDDEIIKALKAVRTFHNGNYAPQIDEAIRRLTMKKSAYVQVKLSDERLQKAVAEAVEKTKAEIEAQPCEDCISKYIKQKIDYLEDMASLETNEGRWVEEGQYLYAISVLEEIEEYIKSLPSVTPQKPKGKWIDVNDDSHGWGAYRCHVCSECKDYYTTSAYEMKYCPNCGAEMSGGGEE